MTKFNFQFTEGVTVTRIEPWDWTLEVVFPDYKQFLIDNGMSKKQVNTLYPGKARDMRTVAARLKKAIKGQEGIKPDFSPYQSGLWHGYEAVIKCLRGEPMTIRESPEQWVDKNQVNIKELIEFMNEANHLRVVAFNDAKASEDGNLIVKANTTGFYNGIECIVSIFERREPKYITGPVVTPKNATAVPSIPRPGTTEGVVAMVRESTAELVELFMQKIGTRREDFPAILSGIINRVMTTLSEDAEIASNRANIAQKRFAEAAEIIKK